MSEYNKTKGLRRLINATLYSFSGFRMAWKFEAAFRQEVILVAMMVPAGLWLGRNAVERGLLLGTCLVVLITELLNSAVEATIDRMGPERHPLSKRAKDLGSAAVFVSLTLTGIVWGLIAIERFTG